MTNEGQLTLELDVRTAEQQEKIDKYLALRENEIKLKVAFFKNKYQTLVDAGFYSEDIEFKYDIVSETHEVNLGTYSDPDKVELTFDVVKGGVKLFRD